MAPSLPPACKSHKHLTLINHFLSITLPLAEFFLCCDIKDWSWALWSSSETPPNTFSSEHQDRICPLHKHLTLTHDAPWRFLPLLTWYLGSLPGGGDGADLDFGLSSPFWQGEWAPLGTSPSYSVPLFPHLQYRMEAHPMHGGDLKYKSLNS